MSHQITKVDLIPNGELSVCNVSQFDNGRVLPFEILENKEAYTFPENIQVELHCRKPDGNIVTLPSESIADNIVTFLSTTQLTACYGKNICEIALYGPNDYLIGSANFILDVEKSPTLGGINSTSAIHDLEDQIRGIAEDVIPEILPGLMGDYYTKEEVDDLLIGILPTDEVTGNPATFNTQIAAPLVNMSCDIVAQGGGGTPTSPVPIVGYTSANINENGNIITIAFGQTVYGGVLDVTRGKLTVTHGKYLLDGNTSRNDLGLTLLSNITQISYVPFISEGKGVSVFLSNIFQDSTNQGLYKIWNNRNSQQPVPRMFLGLPNTVTTIEQAIAWFASNPTEVIYELATPIDIDLTPEVIEAIVGANNVSSDTGAVTVRFKTTIEDYINSRINRANTNRSLLLTVNSDIIKEKSEIKEQSDIIEDIERGDENE